MKLDVATLILTGLVIFAVGAAATARLAALYGHLAALRLWAAGMMSMVLSLLLLLIGEVTRAPSLLLFGAVLNFLYWMLAWSGMRELAHVPSRLAGGLVVSGMFCALCIVLIALRAGPLCRAAVLALFFVPSRLLLAWQVCVRLPRLDFSRRLVALASAFLALNGAAPLLLALRGEAPSALLIGMPVTAPLWYALGFTANAVVMIGLVAMALQQVIAGHGSLAMLERFVSPRRAASLPSPASLSAPPSAPPADLS